MVNVGIPLPKLFERPVGDVFAAVAAVFGVGVEWEALEAIGRSKQMHVNN